VEEALVSLSTGRLPIVKRVLRAATAATLLALMGAAIAAPSFPPIGMPGQQHPGKFIWFDLVTDDLTAARDFYGAVFGWKFRPVAGAPASYTVVEHAGRNIAGMFVHAPPQGATSTARWLALISVKDPAAATRYVESQGGSVIVPPATFAGRGTHVLFRDPQGAVFGVLKSESGDPADTPVDDGDFFWLDLLARDPKKAAEFYQGLAGYEVSLREVGPGVTRAVLAAGGYSRAGIAFLPAAVKQPGWLPYILVDDVAGTLNKVRAAGGKVLVEPRADLLESNLAVIADPRGGVLGIVNWVYSPDAGSAP
jgi:predicted enzyme related to lactoylglutathione lyase